MPPSRRTPQDPRRPRVAGLRNRTRQDSSSPTGSEEQAEQTSTSGATSPESAAPEEATSATSDATESGTRPDRESVAQVADTPAAGATTHDTAPADSTTPDSTTTDAGTGSGTEDSGTDSPADASPAESVDDAAAGASGDETVTVATLPGEQQTSAETAATKTDSATSETATSDATSETATDSGTSEGDAREDSDARPEGDTARADGSTSVKPRRSPLIPVLLAASVVCAALAVWFFLAGQATRGEAGSNQALVDQAGTSEVNGQVTKAVETLFSYDFADTAKTEKAAKNLLVGDAVGKYEDLFKTVKEQAPAQKIVVTTTVKASGVTQLQDDRAEVLLFVDQNAVRTDVGQDNVGPAQLSVTAKKDGDTWKISQINPR